MKLAVIQMAMHASPAENHRTAADLVRRAADAGAELVLLPELYEGHYFPRTKDDARHLASPVGESEAVRVMQKTAREAHVVLPVSFFERDGDRYFNSLAMVDASGDVMGVYRKSHIPDGPGYEEKTHFAEGDTGFMVWDTPIGKVGVGICWDQWFPECARAMVLMGADVLLYPTAIGSEPVHSDVDTRDTWRRVMLGHAAANTTPVAAANRIGTEDGQRFYGSSFISDCWGALTIDMNRTDQGFELADLDIDHIRKTRTWFGLHRDRRPDLYKKLTDPR